MEVVCVMGAAAAAGVGALVLLEGSRPRTVARPGRALRSGERALARLLRRVGELAPVAALMDVPTWRSLVGEVRGSGPGRALDLGEEGAAGALACAYVLTCVAAGVLFASVVAVAVAAVALPVGASAWHARRRDRERRAVAEAMPGVYRTLSVAMGSGQTLAQAVEYVGSREEGPVAEAFARMSLRLRCGVPTERSVELLAEELDAPGTGLLASALVISHRTGCPLRDLLLRSARLVERQGEFERLLSVKTAQVRLSVKVVCLLPVVLVGLLSLISPDFQEGLLTPVGMGCVALALALDGLALLIIRRIVSGVV